jgi:CheY-like chemotaxis protein
MKPYQSSFNRSPPAWKRRKMSSVGLSVAAASGRAESTGSFIAAASSLDQAEGVAARCMIVDDSPDFIDSATRLLESEGLEIVGTAFSGVEAVAIAGSARPDVALVDVQLGEESGLDVARLLADRAPWMRIILISTHARDDIVELLQRTPAFGFLPKTGLSATAIFDLL